MIDLFKYQYPVFINYTKNINSEILEDSRNFCLFIYDNKLGSCKFREASGDVWWIFTSSGEPAIFMFEGKQFAVEKGQSLIIKGIQFIHAHSQKVLSKAEKYFSPYALSHTN